jgi:5-methylcytosine-specific restriction endonuclease McrA
MKIDMLAVAAQLSDEDLLARINVLAGRERHVSAELVAHLAVLYARPSLQASKGYGSLFSYCTQALHLSEDAACNRIEAAKACARFPVLLELLAAGSMTLTSVRILGRHLTPENHLAVLERAKGQTRAQIDALVAELAPRPDAPTLVRKLPAPAAPVTAPVPAALAFAAEALLAPDAACVPLMGAESAPVTRPLARPRVQITAPERYRVQFTIGEDSRRRLERLQALLRREIPGGDAGAIFERALALLEAQVEKAKLGVGAATRPRGKGSIRPGTDKDQMAASRASRHIPQEVKRVVWQRDGGQCAFTSHQGHRCTERTFLEFHHVQPHATGGPANVANISLRCRRHNQYEGELVFGPRRNTRQQGERGRSIVAGTDGAAWLSIRTPPPSP